MAADPVVPDSASGGCAGFMGCGPSTIPVTQGEVRSSGDCQALSQGMQIRLAPVLGDFMGVGRGGKFCLTPGLVTQWNMMGCPWVEVRGGKI